MNAEPNYDVAHLGHVELFTNKPEASLDFFVNLIGLTESGREAGSVYLRVWDDYEFHTLELTASHTTGIGYVGYRTSSEQALLRRASAIEAMGFGRCACGLTIGSRDDDRDYRPLVNGDTADPVGARRGLRATDRTGRDDPICRRR